ncbi:MAG TPA: SDR family oxidoreductase [Dongiaceae bacterium]|nr:SDR family oxidoreductase [Dongiaceae bacterium]
MSAESPTPTTTITKGLLGEEFAGRRVLVSGSSRGIGAAVALAFATLGARVALHGTKKSGALDETAAAIAGLGAAPVVTIADYQDQKAVARSVDEAAKALGGIDILVNNAGTMMGRVKLPDLSDEHLAAVLDLNARSVATASRTALPHLLKAEHGCIVSTTSIAARTGGAAGAGIYAAAKGFVSTFTRALATEIVETGIRVNAVSPGFIHTDFHRRYSTPERVQSMANVIPMKRVGTAEDCVGAYLFLASHRLAGFITGQIIEVNGGQLMP